MSMNFKDDIDDHTRSMIDEFFKDKVVAKDNRQVLFNDLLLEKKKIEQIEKSAKQDSNAKYDQLGTIKTLSDGSRYKLKNSGWLKISD